ncbi:MAG: hypothetical protein AABZ10_08850 [Nitrospirota bacterium]|mgnify:FL=1
MKIIYFFSIFVFTFFTSAAFAQDPGERLNKLEEIVKKQEKTIEQQQKTVEALKQEMEKQKSGRASLEPGAPSASPQSGGLFGGSSLTNPNISAVLNAFAYSSNLTNEELEQRGIPGFTTRGIERQRGFNLDAAELFIFAPVDPFFNFYTTIPVTEDGAELEEAYIVTTALPAGFQIKGGKFKGGFSRLNAQHPHAWDFTDIALPYRAFLGGEGLGGEKGIQLTYLPALPVYTLLGAEVLQGENELLFGPDAGSGPHAFSFFVKSSFDTSDNSTLYFGPSVLFGKTKSAVITSGSDPALGAELQGDSVLYGFEMVWKWKPSSQQGFTLQSEYLYLSQNGDLEDFGAATVNPLVRKQDGFYVQGIYRMNRWRIGGRYDRLAPFSDTFKLAGTEQDLGSAPWRAAGSLEFNPSEFSRIRLQYTHDRTAGDGRENNEVIAQFIFGIGAHAGHPF